MFGRRILGGQPDGFKLLLGYQVASLLSPHAPATPKGASQTAAAPEHPDHKDEDFEAGADRELQSAMSTFNEATFETAQVTWTAGEADAVVLTRLKNASVIHGLHEERVVLALEVARADVPGRAISAATFGLADEEVHARLRIELLPPQVRRIELSRATASGAVAPEFVSELLAACELEGVAKLRCCEGMLPVWNADLFVRLDALRVLNLSNCALSALPPGIGALTNLRELRVSGNKLSGLTSEIGSLRKLHRLVADNNLLTSIPVEIRHCSQLREVSLEGNRLATPVIDLRALARLRSLQLYANPLEFLPELSPCTSLRHLSLANVRIRADPALEKWDVQIAAPPTFSRTHRLAPLFGLIFRRSSCQHPLLAGALGKIAEDPTACSAIVREVGAIQQLILMALSENEVVVQQACKTLGLLGRHDSFTSDEIIQGDVLSAMLSLMCSVKHKSQLAGLHVIAGLALTSEASARKLLTPNVLQALQELVRSGADDVKTAALETLGNLAFCRDNRSVVLAAPGLRDWLARLAQDKVGGVQRRVGVAATRALAILGENEEVRRAIGRPPIVGRGVRILSMDGGGMKGIAIIRELRQLEQRTGRRIHELFDLVCGTSTGGILAVALALKQLSLEDCEQIYRNLGQKVFSRPGAAAVKEEEAGWRDSLYRAYKSGQQSMRVAVYGCKHDAAMFEELLKEYCTFDTENMLGTAMIDTACLNTPKCFVVSTLVSMTPAGPFLFRNYELPDAAQAHAKQLKTPLASSSHHVWQAVRASSAAPYYLDDFKCGSDRFQDGAATANNPAALALAEARLLWPDAPIEAIVSLGSGVVPVQRREKSMSAYLDIGSVLIESACSVDRVDAALATLLPLVPGVAYFRFCPEDVRCGIELDEIDPEQWALLEAATDEYIEREDARFQQAANLLLRGLEPAPEQAASSVASSLRLGSRRSILLVEAPRSADTTAHTHVESVAAAVATLPDVAERCSFQQLPHGAPEPADTSSRSLETAQLVEALSRCRGSLGIVHLAMHATEAGLVGAWTHEVEAVAEPSSAVDTLLEAAGCDPGTSLAALCGAAALVHFPGAGPAELVSLLGAHSQVVAGRAVASVLLQRTGPAAFLTADQVSGMGHALDGQLLVTSSALPQELLRSLMDAGCRAVVCRDAAAPAPAAPAAATFFSCLYRHLRRGIALPQALWSAGLDVPDLAGTFCCVTLVGGEIVAAQISSSPEVVPYVPLEPHN
ncbi:probable calcium-independent phospholipase A2-gamma at C-terminar half [Coccomyxa sp. Obi]|nr:probable calcium-independent phospholipase A2-gamma at C-terminar half [Coccomyxa sp. Obi]